MSKKFSIAFLTLQDISPIEAINIASQTGYSHVGLRLLPAIPNEFIYPLISDKNFRNEAKETLKNTGVKIGDVELIRLNPNTKTEDFDPFFECAFDLGVQNATVVSDDPDLNRFVDNFSKLCEKANAYNISMNLEPIPWTKLKSYEDVIKIVKNIKNAGVLIDTYHFHRLNTSFDIFDKIDPSSIKVIQICDAFKYFERDDDYIRNEARKGRLLPGEGELPLNKFIEHISESAIISLEIPSEKLLKNYSPLQRAKIVLDSTKKLFGEIDI